jgi:hypothetical protein
MTSCPRLGLILMATRPSSRMRKDLRESSLPFFACCESCLPFLHAVLPIENRIDPCPLKWIDGRGGSTSKDTVLMEYEYDLNYIYNYSSSSHPEEPILGVSQSNGDWRLADHVTSLAVASFRTSGSNSIRRQPVCNEYL